MSQEIVINITGNEIRTAILDKSQVLDIHIERTVKQGLVGNIYKGRVSRLLPGIQAAFVDIGLDRSGFLHVSDMAITHEPNASAIESVLAVGQFILVQVYKDSIGSKGARLTTQITLPSRFLVYTPNSFQITFSQKMLNVMERERLSTMIEPDKEGGFIFRTLAEGISQQEVDNDKLLLQTHWQEIKKKASAITKPQLIYQDIPLVLRVLRDYVGPHIEKVYVDDEDVLQAMKDYAQKNIPTLLSHLHYYDNAKPIFDAFEIESVIQQALERRLALPSGGHVVIDQTEAMTTIDINTGSYIGKINLENTVYKTNLEAVSVIAQQIRLRNLGGIIIIDFIDMHDETHKNEVLTTLKNAFTHDHCSIQISEISSLGLVQMTRKRTRESLEHTLCQPCPLCHSRGSIKSANTICYEIIRELNRIHAYYPPGGFLILAPAKVAEKLSEENNTLLHMQEKLARIIKVRVDTSYREDQYDIVPLSDKE